MDTKRRGGVGMADPPPIRISQSAASRRVAQELPRSRSRTVINPA